MSATPVPPPPDDHAAATDQPTHAAHEPAATDSPDPITGEPGAHPVGVGVGALSAGVAGAAIGSIGGPIGVLIGAAIGAVAGGLAGKEVAATGEAPIVVSDAVASGSVDEPATVVPPEVPTPISMGSVPGEGFRASAGSGYADDGSLTPPVTAVLPATPRAYQEDDALPMTAVDAPATAATGLQPPPMPETEPLAGTSAFALSEEAGAPTFANDEETVRVAAYYHYLERTRSGQGGDEVSDWLVAEHEVTQH